jgi:glutamate dehydrogenase
MRVLDAVRDRVEDAQAPPTGDASTRAPATTGPATNERATNGSARLPPEVATELARVTLRRLPDAELARLDVDALAADLVEGARLVADRRGSVAISIRCAEDDDEREVPANGDGSVLQLATDDRPFLLSTALEELARAGVRVLRHLHPIVGTERDADGQLVAVHPARGAAHRETLLHLVLDRRIDPETQSSLHDRLTQLVDDVRRATDDFPTMRAVLRDHAATLRDRTIAPPVPVRRSTDDPTRGPTEDPTSERTEDSAAATDPTAADDPADDPGEVAALIDWLLDEHVVLLGLRRYELLDAAGTPVATSGAPAAQLRVVTGSGAGLLADTSASRYREPVALDPLDPLDRLEGSLATAVADPRLLVWSRTRARSTVQRHVRMEHLAFVEHAGPATAPGGPGASGASGAEPVPTGLVRVLVLFTRRGEDAPAATTPVLRRKLAAVIEGEDIVPGSHDELLLTDLFQALPKDELFHIGVDPLRRLLIGLLHAEDHREIRTFTRVDRATRTLSVLMAVPRDSWSPQLRDRVEAHLNHRFDADRIDVAVSLGERNEAVARFLLTVEHDVPDVDDAQLEDEVRQLARSWTDEVMALLIERVGAVAAERLVTTIGRRLPRSYRDTVEPDTATHDLALVDRVLRERTTLAIDWRAEEAEDRWRLRVVSHGAALELSAFLPVLEALGLIVVEEVPHRLLGEDDLHLHDFGVRVGPPAAVRLTDPGVRGRAADAVLAAWRGHADIDPLTQLVLIADVTWRDVAVLRAYRRYRRQLGTPYTPAYVEETLVEHAAATAALLARFRARFDPALGGPTDRQPATDAADEAFADAMGAVTRIDADRILRGLSDLVDATLRTNAYRPDATADATGEPYVALKFDPSRIPEMPAPIPHREVFVHSPRVEGVHLRFGPVARGGLRWSDRRDDVRTEVLGLVKAQVLKNALIVPTGAKGGFVLTRSPTAPTGLREEVRRQYVTFVRGLLDVTDDIAETGAVTSAVAAADRGEAADAQGRVVPPPNVVRHDGDDPYLVVAADRGTAAFSDTANAVAARYGYWLGDAFASGGSNGYDHKALGVTAKGAWRAVARHFRELGIDVDTQPIDIAGIGDLSGDVFANGLLRSEAVRLVAAFDHRHIFLDPDPDPAASFAERQRIAALTDSSWDDYDRSVLSPGGFVVPRDVRRVSLTPEVQDALRLEVDQLSPPELIRAILGAPVDLLWAGGIGTYIKARTERHSDVGDRANDEVRVDAGDVRARVIGEGANLFLTQRARIELARRGARVDQDAIHNAAGVATSDAEVNLKILLDLAIADGRLAAADRDAVLADLADEVVAAVLEAVDRQVAALSAEAARGANDVDALEAFIARLEASGDLDRDVEVLPTTAQLAQRAAEDGSLTRPELATLLAWAKRELKEALLAADAPPDPVLAEAVTEPFPAAAVERFGDLLPRHRLHRELVATAVANGIVDRLGISFASGLAAESGAPLPLVARAVRIATHVIDAPRWWDEVEALAATHDPERVRELADAIDELVVDLTGTLLVDPLLVDDPLALRARDTAVAAELLANAFEVGSNDQRRARRAHTRWLVDDLVDPELARFLACALDLAAVPDISAVQAQAHTDRSVVTVADVAFRLAETLGIDRLEAQLAKIAVGDGWARRQHRGVERDLRRLRRDAAAAALAAAAVADAAASHADRKADRDADRETDRDAEDIVAGFLTARRTGIARARTVVAEVTRRGTGLDGIAVAARAVRDALGH